jgi:hypothetical protein
MARRDVEELEVGTVIQQQGDKVTVAVPLVGFPPGFQLQPGDRVILVNEAAGVVARPLVHFQEGAASAANLAALQIAPQAIGSDKLGAARPAGNVGVWTIESSAAGTARVVAVREKQE